MKYLAPASFRSFFTSAFRFFSRRYFFGSIILLIPCFSFLEGVGVVFYIKGGSLVQPTPNLLFGFWLGEPTSASHRHDRRHHFFPFLLCAQDIRSHQPHSLFGVA